VAGRQACSINIDQGVRFTWKYFRISQHASEASRHLQALQPDFHLPERLTITLHDDENHVRFFRFDRCLISDLRTLPLTERRSTLQSASLV
jgi:hypothetical protein